MRVQIHVKWYTLFKLHQAQQKCKAQQLGLGYGQSTLINDPYLGKALGTVRAAADIRGRRAYDGGCERGAAEAATSSPCRRWPSSWRPERRRTPTAGPARTSAPAAPRTAPAAGRWAPSPTTRSPSTLWAWAT